MLALACVFAVGAWTGAWTGVCRGDWLTQSWCIYRLYFCLSLPCNYFIYLYVLVSIFKLHCVLVRMLNLILYYFLSCAHSTGVSIGCVFFLSVSVEHVLLLHCKYFSRFSSVPVQHCFFTGFRASFSYLYFCMRLILFQLFLYFFLF